jgi:hypothetical protein
MALAILEVKSRVELNLIWDWRGRFPKAPIIWAKVQLVFPIQLSALQLLEVLFLQLLQTLLSSKNHLFHVSAQQNCSTLMIKKLQVAFDLNLLLDRMAPVRALR